jgi:hypothetical protein
MDINSSIDVITKYSIRVNLSIADAITKLSEDTFDDWTYTLPGAPKGYQPKTTAVEEQALKTFSKYRSTWVKQAKLMGVDLTGFTDLEAV